jgi:broad specificity phosphatase PhoE
VEPRPAVRERAVAGLAGIAQRHPGRTVVVVSHDAVNREVLAALDPALGEPDAIAQENGCFNLLLWRAGQWRVASINQLPERNGPDGCTCPSASSP